VVLAPGQGSQQALLAWVTLEEGASLDAERARAALRTSLPDYMLPTRIVPLAELPLTANGKLDRQRLLQMDGLGLPIIGQPAHQHVALQGEFEEALAQLWREVLPLPDNHAPGRMDDFFALGGHSLLAVQLAARVQQRLGRELSVRDIFAALRRMSRRCAWPRVVAAKRQRRRRQCRCCRYPASSHYRCPGHSSGCGSSISWSIR